MRLLAARDVFHPVDTPDEAIKCRYGVVIQCADDLAFVATATTKGIGDPDLILDVQDWEARRYWGLQERSQFLSRHIYAYWTGGFNHDVLERIPAGKQQDLQEALEARLLQHAADPFGQHRIMTVCHRGVLKHLSTPKADGFKVALHEAAQAAARAHSAAGDSPALHASAAGADKADLR